MYQQKQNNLVISDKALDMVALFLHGGRYNGSK